MRIGPAGGWGRTTPVQVAPGGIEGGTIIPRCVGSVHGHPRASRDEAFLAVEVLPEKLAEFLADSFAGHPAVVADASQAVG